MKRTLLITITLLTVTCTNAQNELYNNGAGLYLSAGAAVQVNGSFTNTGTANFQNYGTLALTGNTTNNQTLSAYTGKLIFNGNTPQTLSGTKDMLTKDLEINNAAGAILNAKLQVDGTATFINGIITATVTAAPLWFTATAIHTGVTDAAHVNGYVVKEGTGNFTYPVGDGARYQRVEVNATVNGSGIQVKYDPADAGAAPFGTIGAWPTPLLYYNTKEYWDISPLSTATGNVTVYWDDYNNVGITSTAHLVVAHKRSGYWLNEGATSISGTITSGSVTSASVNTWSPFTLGSISSLSTLPVTWLKVSGSLNANKQAVISWLVSEWNMAVYQVEKSNDAYHFEPIGQINGRGDGSNHYSYTAVGQLTASNYYRIKQTDANGYYTYSPIIRIQMATVINNEINVYPVPFSTGFTVTSNKAQKASLVNARGQVLQQVQLSAGATYIPVPELFSGVYYLITENGQLQKLVKK